MLYPFKYTDFSYESLRIAQIHVSFTDPYDLATFTSDLRVVTSYYELFKVCYGLITSYYDTLTAEFHDLLRVVMEPTRNLSVKNYLLTCCHEYLRVSYEYLRVLTI